MFDWSGKNGDKSGKRLGKSQGILTSCVSGNPVQGPKDNQTKTNKQTYMMVNIIYMYLLLIQEKVLHLTTAGKLGHQTLVYDTYRSLLSIKSA